VYLIEEPMAAAIGADIPINEPRGPHDRRYGGAGRRKWRLVSLGDMVVSKSLDVAGDELDEAIIQYFRRKYNLLIGETSAEETKIKIGSVFSAA